MENLEHENRELREEVTVLKAGMANLIALMESLVVAQNQPPLAPPSPHIAQPQQTTVASKVLIVPIFVTPVTAAQTVCLRVTRGECLKISCQKVTILIDKYL